MSAPDPSRALLWMRQAGVLTKVLPESEKWGIDAIHGLVAAERDLGWAAGCRCCGSRRSCRPTRRGMKALADRLKLSKAETERLMILGAIAEDQPAESAEKSLARTLYRSEQQADASTG